MVAVGHGVAIVPLGLILLYGLPDLVFGVASLRDLFSEWHGGTLFFEAWIGLYVISMIVVGIYYFTKRRKAKHVA